MNIFIRWHIGYWAYVDMQDLRLRNGNIYFYNEKGDVVTCSLEDSVQFDMRVECGFRKTKSCYLLNFSKGDVFAVRHKDNEYDLYIPMSEVGFMKLNKMELLMNNGMDIMVKRRCCLVGHDLNFWNPSCDTHKFYLSRDKKRINFEIYVETKQTDKGNMWMNWLKH